jgi:hypothetical protein
MHHTPIAIMNAYANPANNIIFINRIISFAISENNKRILSKQLELYLCINDIWSETVLYFLNTIWKQKNNYGFTTWNFALENIKSDKFWEFISKMDDKWFEEMEWNKPNGYNFTIWHYAPPLIKTDKFWNAIIEKSDDWFINNGWNKKNENGCTVWHYAVLYIKSKKFWNFLEQKDTDWFNKMKWSSQYGSEKHTVWHYAAQNEAASNFLESIISLKKKEWFEEQNWNKKNKLKNTVWDYLRKHGKKIDF